MPFLAMMVYRMSGLTDRLFAIVELLQGQRKLTTQALAEHFGVSERTIRRDLVRLQDLDIELDILPGRNGGVKLLSGTLLQALRFTDDEVLVLALGLKQAQQMKNLQLAKAAESALNRLEHVLTEPLRERLGAVLQVAAEDTPDLSDLTSSTLLDVAEAVNRCRRLEVRYHSRNSGFTYRKLDPYGVVHVNQHWYVTGYCHLRQDTRVFRLDRLEVLAVSAESFVVPEAFDALSVVSSSLAQAPFPGSVTCRIWLNATPEEVSRHVPSYAATFEPQDTGVLLRVVVHPDWFDQVVWYLLDFPAAIRVIEPPALQEAFAALSLRAETLSRGECA